MEIETQGVTPETASAPAVTQSAPPDSRTGPRTLEEFTSKLADQFRQSAQPPQPPGKSVEAGQDTPPAETEAAPQQQIDPSQDDAADSDKGQWPQSAVERVKKLKEQRRQAREELEQLKSKVQTLETQVQAPKPTDVSATPTADDPLAHITHPDEIRAERTKAEGLMEHVEELLDDLHDDPQSVEERLKKAKVNIGVPEDQWTPKDMRDWLKSVRADAQRVVRAAPKREEFLVKESQAVDYVGKNFPTYADPASDDFKLAASVIKEFPELRKRPDWMMHAVIYAQGYKALQAKVAPAAAKRPAANPPPAPRVPGAPQSSPRSVEPDELSVASEKLKKGGLNDAENYAKVALARSTKR